MLIELLKSTADAADKNIIECILYKVYRESSGCGACKEGEEKDKEENKEKSKEKRNCKVCREICREDKEYCNAVINEVKRSRIVLRLLKEFKNNSTIINTNNNAVYICIRLDVVILDS